ncbi:hypothetical protein SMBr_15220 [Shewanella sp. M-Br]|nr:hypothetical protein SMBr_15220 [Shewanella sp. M-Br]
MQAVVLFGRGGRTRTRNHRFWRGRLKTVKTTCYVALLKNIFSSLLYNYMILLKLKKEITTVYAVNLALDSPTGRKDVLNKQALNATG